jgi:hypothetical protein
LPSETVASFWRWKIRRPHNVHYHNERKIQVKTAKDAKIAKVLLDATQGYGLWSAVCTGQGRRSLNLIYVILGELGGSSLPFK